MSDLAFDLLFQIPLAGVVVLVVVLFLRYLKDYNTQMMAFLDSQAEAAREFLREQRSQSNDAIGRLAEEIKTISQETASVTTLIAAHDARVQEKNRK